LVATGAVTTITAAVKSIRDSRITPSFGLKMAFVWHDASVIFVTEKPNGDIEADHQRRVPQTAA
jgi:hypothetical protein